MIWSRALICLTVVISLLLGAIWPNNAVAATAPDIAPLGSIATGLTIPGALDVDAAGNLYVADIDGQNVLKFDVDGELIKTFGSVLVSGKGLAVTPDGSRLYLATEEQVVALDAGTGEVSFVVGGDATVRAAGEIDLDSVGNVYVVDPVNAEIKVFSPSGSFRFGFGGLGADTDGKFLSIEALAVNDGTSEIYVVGQKKSGIGQPITVQVFNLDGQYVSSFDSVGGVMSSVAGVAFDSAGREYYVDRLDSTLRVGPTISGFTPVVFNIRGAGVGRVILPWDVDFDTSLSRLYVSSDSGEIEVFGVDEGIPPVKNVAPTLPEMVSPVADSEVDSLQPRLIFNNAADENGDALTYDVQVSGAASLLYTVAEDVTGQTAVQIDQALVENAAYSWQVMARDGELDSGWTLAETFYVNSIEEAPSVPVLESPLAGDGVGGVDQLIWQPATDNDPVDSVVYLVEIATDNTFATIVASERVEETSVAIGSLVDYPALVSGNRYFWRVTAIDSSELKLEAVSEEIGQFYYNPAMLSIDANMPDAKVYLGGNAAYSGNFIGTTPLQLQDVAAGTYTVVIERAGCETFISQVEVSKGGYVSVNANLLLAVKPDLARASALRSIKTQLKSAAQVAPFVVDFNNDGMDDLLVGDEAGAVSLFTALAKRGSKIQYSAAESLDFGRLPGTALFVVDWNNDNKKDVLVGDANGNVSIYKQSANSSDLAPEFDPVLFLRNGNGAVIDVGSQANPAVVDFDLDGDKDLVVGTGNGKLYLYLNNGSDASPELASYPELLITFGSSVSPLFVDWDADGQRDLLVSVEGSLHRCLPQEDGSYLVEATALIDAAANGIESGARYFVVDSDNSQGKDVYIGLVGGEVQMMRSAGKEFLPSVTTALLDKLGLVSDLAVAAGIDIAALVADASIQISEGDFSGAAQSARDIADVGARDAELYDAAVELVALLNQ